MTPPPTPPSTSPPTPSDTVAVLDFETTGMSPAMGARATEIAVVLVRGGRVVDRYASLMHSGAWVPPFIEQLTGISNRMLAAAPPAARVMREVADFTRGCALVAHNASFDRGFWLHEMALAEALADAAPAFGCTLLLSRRLYPEAANHKLGTLARLHGIEPTGRAHRALADAEMAAVCGCASCTMCSTATPPACPSACCARCSARRDSNWRGRWPATSRRPENSAASGGRSDRFAVAAPACFSTSQAAARDRRSSEWPQMPAIFSGCAAKRTELRYCSPLKGCPVRRPVLFAQWRICL